MIVAVLRVSGVKFDVDRFVQQYAVTPDTSWRGGVSDTLRAAMRLMLVCWHFGHAMPFGQRKCSR